MTPVPADEVGAGPVVVLLPSPFVGPAVWRPVAANLRDRGWEVAEVTPPATAPRGPTVVRDRFLAAVPADREVVVVAHSNAGAFVPAVAARPGVVATVFVDAVLPPRAGRLPLAPPALRDHLADLATDGRLPRWTDWFDEADVAPLFPDATTRRAVVAEQHCLPLDYVRSEVAVPAGWDDRPGGYLAFGDTYAEERADARARGWPVRTLDGGHLHMIVDPAAVTAAVLDLVAAMVEHDPTA